MSVRKATPTRASCAGKVRQGVLGMWWLVLAFTSARGDLVWDARRQIAEFPAGANEARVAFTARNTGMQPLVIRAITTSCDCATAKATRTPIAPDTTCQIDVTLKRRDVNGAPGALVRVALNGGATDELVVTSKASEPLKLTPVFVWWRANSETSPREIIVQAAADAEPIQRLTGAASDTTFSCVAERLDERRWRVRITPSNTSKPRLATLTFEAYQGEKAPAIRANAYAKITAAAP